MMEKHVTVIVFDGHIQVTHVGLSKIELLGIAEFLRTEVTKEFESIPAPKKKVRKKK